MYRRLRTPWKLLFSLCIDLDMHISMLRMASISCLNVTFLKQEARQSRMLPLFLSYTLILARLKKWTGIIKIIRYDFDDPQAGKKVCDRQITTDSEEPCAS